MMSDPNKTVFISYRRSASRHLARSIFMDLTQHGYDVFLDVNTIDSGAFDSVILNQIGARTHFVVLLSPTALERCVNVDDWLCREIYQAMQLRRNIVPIIEEGFNFESETGYLPVEWRDQFRRLSGLRLFHDYFEDGMTKLRERFLNPPQFPVVLRPVSFQEQREVQQRIEQVKTDISQQSQIAIPPKPKIILPQPFDWCYIPAGQTVLTPDAYNKDIYITHNKTVNVSSFWMAKYPITNNQYAQFLQYDSNYLKPENWDDKLHEDYPVVGITWQNALDFCYWLSQIAEQHITLPTDEQWQRAAQGDDNRIYPWGNDFAPNGDIRCNTSESGNRKITSVKKYPNGASPFGVMGMAGNVWEYCLTHYTSGRTNGNDKRILRGGSYDADKSFCENTYRIFRDTTRLSDKGFRVVCRLD